MIIVSGDCEFDMLGRYKERAYFWSMMKVAGYTQIYLDELDGYDRCAIASSAFFILKHHMEILENR